MKRKQISYLQEWMKRKNHKPLIIRGARQVGKTYLIRQFAAQHFKNLVEINFDETPDKAGLFISGDIHKTLVLLKTDLDTDIIPGETLLFLDEIQRTPEIFAHLRYFYEKIPSLHIIAAGSLLDFVLAEHEFSMPVGRVEFLHMGPLDLYEFLGATGGDALLEYLKTYSLPDTVPESIHKKLLSAVSDYCIIGGMPAVVKIFAEEKDPRSVRIEQQSILQTFRHDFSKYAAKVNIHLLTTVFEQAPFTIGKKLVYTNLDRNLRAKDLASALFMMQKAGLFYAVRHADGNNVPLRSEKNQKHFKLLFLDTGLLACSLGIKYSDYVSSGNITAEAGGSIAEQFIGQQLLYSDECFEEPELFYWRRDKAGTSSEVDYLTENSGQIIPIEVKSGETGSLKSLHVFTALKKKSLGLRFNTSQPCSNQLETAIALLPRHPFTLISLPLYMVLEYKRLTQRE